MNKICVYTCITGNYDNIIEICKKEDDIDYICFTNNKNIKSNTWDVRYINEDLDNLTMTRKVKILDYKYVPEYDISVWIDGAVNIEKPINSFLNECCELDKYDMTVFKHKYRDCIYDEINECVRLNKETIENARRVEQILVDDNYPRHNGLTETTVLVRKNIDSVNRLMDDWYFMLSTYSRRDQLSFNYCLWKNPIRIKFLDMYVFDNKYFKHNGHNEIIRTNKYRIIYGDSSEFDYKYVEDGYFKTNNNVNITGICKRNTNVIILELYDEVGSTISNVEINGSSDYILYNVYDLGDNIYFYDKPIIEFNGEFKLGGKIDINFQLKRNTPMNLVNTISEKNNIIIELIEKENKYNIKIQQLEENVKACEDRYTKLNEEHVKVINSKGWKVISKVRAVKNKIINN